MMLSGIQRKALTRTGVLRTRSLLGGRLLTTSTASEPTSFSFENIVSEQLFQALSSQNFLRATPIQSMSYSAVRSGNDVVIGAETGSGKTLAYLLPIVDEILSISSTSVIDFPLGFILTPNKELCNQVEQMSHGLIQALNGRGADIRIREHKKYLVL